MHGTVLIVDDEEDIRELIRLRLSTLGLEVRQADSGRQAVIEQQEHPCDAILLDQRMPGMTGLAVARRLLATGCECPMAIYSAYLNPEVYREAEERGLPTFAKNDWRSVMAWLEDVLPD